MSQCDSDDVIMFKERGEHIEKMVEIYESVRAKTDVEDSNTKRNLQTQHTGTHF